MPARARYFGEETRNTRIVDLWMQCYTQEEIAEAVECDQMTVKRTVADSTRSGNRAEMSKPAALHQGDFDPPPYNV